MHLGCGARQAVVAQEGRDKRRAMRGRMRDASGARTFDEPRRLASSRSPRHLDGSEGGRVCQALYVDVKVS